MQYHVTYVDNGSKRVRLFSSRYRISKKVAFDFLRKYKVETVTHVVKA